MSEQEIDQYKDKHGAYASATPFIGRRTGQKSTEHVIHGCLVLEVSSCFLQQIGGYIYSLDENHVGSASQCDPLRHVYQATVPFHLPVERIHEECIAQQIIQCIEGE